MKIVRLGIVLVWLAVPFAQRASGQEPATTPAGAGVPMPDTQPAAAASPPSFPRLKGSQIPHEQVGCAACHTEPTLWEGEKQKLYVAHEALARDIHWQKGVVCSDCHGGDPTSTKYADAHAGLIPIALLRDRCAVCHKEERLALVKGVHAKAGVKDDQGRGQPLDCAKCHGTNPHSILPVTNEDSPVRSPNQVQTCGSCHAEEERTYAATAHGKGLFEAGLKVTAVCADCHGSHGIFYAADRRSTLHRSNVAATCSRCHKNVEDRLQNSVHGGREHAKSALPQPGMAAGLIRTPICTDCHPGHPILSPSEAEFRPPIDGNCGSCHPGMYSRVVLSMHSMLTDHGFAAAAKCSACHGSHDTLPVDDPNSRVAAGQNRLHTCQKCHTYATKNVAQFDPHANFKDAAAYPTLHDIYSGVRWTINVFFLCYVIHAAVWFVRGFFERLKHGGDSTFRHGKYFLPRFEPMQRTLYVALLAAFLGLTLTGLCLKYSDVPWGQRLASTLGGFRSAGTLHQSFAMFVIIVFAIYLVRTVAGIWNRVKEHGWKSALAGPDSLLPNTRDVADFWRMCLWFIGFGRKPGFERWAYWEKLDYWAFLLVIALIGFTGVALWLPTLISILVPGTVLNVAKVLHSEFALYAASVLFVIHFYHAHLRPEKFPMDMSVITGVVSEEHLRKYRPDYIARLEHEGKLKELRQASPSRRNVWMDVVAGMFVFTCGLCLLAVALLASLEE